MTEIKPATVQIYTIPKADTKSGLKPVPKSKLEKIAADVNELGITCEIVD